MRFLFVIDPLETLVPKADTSLGLISAARRRRVRVEVCGVTDVGVGPDGPFAFARPAAVGRGGRGVFRGPAKRRPLAAYDVVWYRKDPPFDLACLHLCRILALASEGGPFVVNDPEGLIRANEKLYALRFPDLIPPTLVTADRAAARDFVRRHGEAVGKPLDGFGGVGVLRLGESVPGTPGVIDALTDDGRRLAIFQKYLPEAEREDTRVFLFFGEVAGVMHRTPGRGDFRANLHAGGKSALGKLTGAQRATVAAVAEAAMRDGLYFVGLDLVGDRLIEVNVTSPTGLRHHHRDGGPDLCARLVEEVVRRAR